ncbi:hypothetical protein SLE2022_255770 [Rubroshorea leprosula]
MKQIYEQKLMHKCANKILHRISYELSTTLNARELIESGVIPAFFQAVKHGIMEFLDEISVTSPYIFSCTDENSRDIFMHAIEYRQEKLFLNQDISNQNVPLIAFRDKDNYNVLHMAAKLAPDTWLARISGPAT